jgi:hypothetical protein
LPNGTAATPSFQVPIAYNGQKAVPNSLDEHDPHVGFDQRGYCVVTGTYDSSKSPLNRDVGAVGYNVNDFTQGTNLISTNGQAPIDWRWSIGTGANEQHTSIAMAADGKFAIAYESTDGGNILLQRVNPNGSLMGSPLPIGASNTQVLDMHPSVAMDQDGNCVVVYEHRQQVWNGQLANGFKIDVDARRVPWKSDPAVGPVGLPITVLPNQGGTLNQAGDPNWYDLHAAVAVAAHGGAFVVANQDVYGDVYVTEVTGSNQVGNPVKQSITVAVHSETAVSIDGSGRYLVTYSTDNSPLWAPIGVDIDGQRGTLPPPPLPPVLPPSVLQKFAAAVTGNAGQPGNGGNKGKHSRPKHPARHRATPKHHKPARRARPHR